MTLSSAGVALVEILRFLEILQRILRGIYLANGARGRLLKLRVLRGLFGIFLLSMNART